MLFLKFHLCYGYSQTIVEVKELTCQTLLATSKLLELGQALQGLGSNVRKYSTAVVFSSLSQLQSVHHVKALTLTKSTQQFLP